MSTNYQTNSLLATSFENKLFEGEEVEWVAD